MIEDPSVKRLLTITGVNINAAAGLVAAIGDVRRFSSPQKLVAALPPGSLIPADAPPIRKSCSDNRNHDVA
jgi:Transposase IS116/IS110/IS902 family